MGRQGRFGDVLLPRLLPAALSARTRRMPPVRRKCPPLGRYRALSRETESPAAFSSLANSICQASPSIGT